MSLSSFSCAKCQYVLECVLCMFCAYFCCNDLSSSRIANFPATGKRTVGILALSGSSHSSYSHFFGEGGGGNYLFYFCKMKIRNFYERP